jgi:hypothetical protein
MTGRKMPGLTVLNDPTPENEVALRYAQILVQGLDATFRTEMYYKHEIMTVISGDSAMSPLSPHFLPQRHRL